MFHCIKDTTYLNTLQQSPYYTVMSVRPFATNHSFSQHLRQQLVQYSAKPHQAMKNTLIVLSLLITLGCTTAAKAQKAYDIISYKSIIYGNRATLQLADGYLLASRITIRSKFGKQVLAPLTSEPDVHGDLRFDLVESTSRYKNNFIPWLTLKSLNDAEYPLKIKAVYRDGKTQTVVVFTQQN